MSTSPLFTMGGAMSGLDTNSIIRQLMQLERVPLQQLQSRQAKLRAIDDAWGQVNGKLSSFRTALDKVRQSGSFSGFVSVSSSNSDAVTATKIGTPATGSISFTVDALARAHQFAFSNTFASPDAVVGDGSDVVLQQDGVEYRIPTTSSTTLAELASQVNQAVPGAGAQVVKVSDSIYQLVVTSRETGTAKAITVVGNPPVLGGINTLQAAADARLTIGAGAEALQVTRSSNTITDLVDGVSLELKQTTTSAVNVSTAKDVDGAATAVKDMVEALNGALSTLKNLTKYDPDAKKAGLLQGDPTARQLAIDLRHAISSIASDLSGAYTSAGTIGISLTRDGAVTLDEAKLKQALSKDFDAVAQLLSRTTTTTAAQLRTVSVSDTLAAGTYAVEVTAAATVASKVGSAYAPPAAGAPVEFTITSDEGVSAAVQITDAEATVADAIAKINAALDAAGITTIRASESGGAIQLAEHRAGSAVEFSVTAAAGDALGLLGTYTGTDIQGTIGGVAAIGDGRRLTGTDAMAGLVVRVTDDSTGAIGSVTITDGVGGALHAVMKEAEGANGSIARVQTSLSDRIRYFDDRVADFEVRLAGREKTLRAKFTALETALSRLQAGVSGILAQMQLPSQPN